MKHKIFLLILVFFSKYLFSQDTAFKANGDTMIINTVQKTYTECNTVVKAKAVNNTNKFYIDNNGNDANNGLSPATAWQTVSKVNGRTFQAGDSILFNRGGMWREQLIIPSSGAAGKYITFGAYGTGARPIINGANIVTGWISTGVNTWSVANPNVTNSRAMVVIDDSLYDEASSLAGVNSPRKYFISSGQVNVWSATNPNSRKSEISKRDYCVITALLQNSKKYIQVADIEVRYAGRAGIYFEGPGESQSNALNGASVIRRCLAYANRLFGMAHVDHYDSLLVEDCEAYYNGNGLYSWVADEGTFRRCITANQIHYEATSGFTDGGGVQGYQADNWTAENCLSTADYDAIHLDCGGVPCHGTIRYNKIYNSRAGSPNTPCMGIGSLGVGGRIDIYYNLMVNGASAAFESYSTMQDQVYFYNNTMYNSATTGTESVFGNYQSGINWNIKNNIFVREYVSGEYNMINGGGLPTTMDNNLYYIYNPVSGTLRNFYGSARTTLSAWQTATGKDASALSVDPLFVNKTSDWKLQAGSPCINTGAAVGLTKDIEGKPISGLPDIGCYEF